jgi:hypothetical protein
MSAFVAIGALLQRKFVRATIFGLVYPMLLFVWPPRSLYVQAAVVAALVAIDWLVGDVAARTAGFGGREDNEPPAAAVAKPPLSE